jgi:pimeloyl-ACP methyl ester carboxylesterase
VPATTAIPTAKISYQSFDGLTLNAYQYGSEKDRLTVLCLHGLTRNHKDFEPMITELDCQYNFLAVDVRGRGTSDYDPDSKNYIPPVYVRDVLSLIEHLQLEQFAIIGTSMGGIMSMLMMPLIGKQVLGVVLNDIGPAVEPVGLRRIGNYVGRNMEFADWDSATAAVLKNNQRVFPSYSLSDWRAFAERTCRQRSDGTVVMDYDPRIREAFRSVPAIGFARFMAWRLFAHMQSVPLLLVRGQTSDLLSDRNARRMVRRHGNARLLTVPDAGHAPMLDEREAVMEIRLFLDQIARSGADYANSPSRPQSMRGNLQ